MGSGSIQSGSIASGQIGRNHLQNAAIGSGAVASGVLSVWHLVSGFVSSGLYRSGSIASGNISYLHLASGAVNSGHVGSASVLGANCSGAHGIASGTVGTFDLGDGVIIATHIASGFAPVFGSGVITSGTLASGIVSRFKMASGAVNSGHIGPAAVMGHANSGAFNIASGTITNPNFASGSLIPYSQEVNVFDRVVGATWQLLTEEPISGTRAVAISQSGRLLIAMASVSGRMPAVGIVAENRASGDAAQVKSLAAYQFASGLGEFTTAIGQPVYVGRSGQISPFALSWNSGGFLSGDVIQQVGASFNSGAVLFTINAPFTAEVFGAVVSGELASGIVSRFQLASGAVNSGHVGSGAVAGQLGPGAFNILSGTIAAFDLGSGIITNSYIGSGAITSGKIASGSIGFNHFTSGLLRGFVLPCVEAISGLRAVCITSGNVLANAMAGSGLRLPVVGIVTSGFVSGDTVQVYNKGVLTVGGTLDLTWSGQVGKTLICGSAGVIIATSLAASGQSWNRLGVSLSGGMIINIDPQLTSGAISTPAGNF
jgi:hypothetical protein